jgi:hypothetical protein
MMDGWYIVDSVGKGSLKSPRRPKYADEFKSYSCHQLGNSGKFLVRFYGKRKTHNEIAKKKGVRDIGDKGVANRLSAAFSGNRGPDDLNAAGWENRFYVNKSEHVSMKFNDR